MAIEARIGNPRGDGDDLVAGERREAFDAHVDFRRSMIYALVLVLTLHEKHGRHQLPTLAGWKEDGACLDVKNIGNRVRTNRMHGLMITSAGVCK